MQRDNGVQNLISAAYEEGRDVFTNLPFPDINTLCFDGLRCVVVLPGTFAGNEHMPYCNACVPFVPNSKEMKKHTVFADVRYFADESFGEFLSQSEIRRIYVPFAECACASEYGYRESYAWLSEYKAQCKHFCQTVVFYSPNFEPNEEFFSFFGGKSFVSLKLERDIDAKVNKAVSVRAKFHACAFEAEKHMCEKVCVICNSRNEAKEFSGFLLSRGTKFHYIDGTVCVDERRKILDEIDKDETGIVVATKTVLNEALFRRFSKCVLCGFPFSSAHLSRCSALTLNGMVHVVYCDDDFVRNKRISDSFAAVVGNGEIADERHEKLLRVKEFLES